MHTMHIPRYVPNQHCPNEQIICGGQPSSDQLAAFAHDHGHTVVNLRSDAEMAALHGWNEGTVVRSLGMRYVRIPIERFEDIDQRTCRVLGEAMAPVGGDPVLIHSKDGDMVGALMALKSVWLDLQPVDIAMQIGRDAGMDTLTPKVRDRLQGESLSDMDTQSSH